MAFIGKSALKTGGNSVQPSYSGATAGNLLSAQVSASMSTPASFTLSGATSGWVQRSHVGSVNIQAEIWEKIAVGNDTMPTWNASGANDMECVVAEFSNTTIFDQSGTATGTTSPKTVTASGTDGGTGRLIIALVRERNSVANTQTFTHNINAQGGGVGINVLGDNSSSSLTAHHHSVYCATAATGTSPDTDAASWGTSTHAALCIASYSASAVPQYSIVQHQISAGGTSGTPTASLTWAQAPTQGNLLLAIVTAALNAGVFSEHTSQGWIFGSGIYNATNGRSEVWWRIAGPGEGTTGPSFDLSSSVLYEVAQYEVTGFGTGGIVLDAVSNEQGSGVSAIQVGDFGGSSFANEFLFGAAADLEGATSGITWTASTVGGSATLGADLDTINPPASGIGLRTAWATTGALGTAPFISFNLSSGTNTKLTSVGLSFVGVVDQNPLRYGYGAN